MKRFFISLAGGLLLLGVWVLMILATGGADGCRDCSPLYAPVNAWLNVLDEGLGEYLADPPENIISYALIVVILYGPFLLAFSLMFDLAVRIAGKAWGRLTRSANHSAESAGD